MGRGESGTTHVTAATHVTATTATSVTAATATLRERGARIHEQYQ